MLTLVDGSRHEATLFRAPNEEIDGLLESDAPFFPMDEGGLFRLYARGAIAALSVAHEDDTELAALGARFCVVVHLRGGAILRGELRFVAPRGSARPLDHLNDESKTFALYEGARVHHVVKAHVEYVEETLKERNARPVR